MGDLEKVDAREPPAHEVRIDRLLDVPRQEEPPTAGLAEQHDRRVVDARPRARWIRRHGAPIRPHHPKPDRVHRHDVARRDGADGHAMGSEPGAPRLVRGARSPHPVLDRPPHAVPLEQRRKAAHVILVRVRQHDDVDAAVPGRDPLIEGRQQRRAVRAAIDEHTTAALALDQDRVALADVED